MSQISSLPQPTQSVSRVLTADNPDPAGGALPLPTYCAQPAMLILRLAIDRHIYALAVRLRSLALPLKARKPHIAWRASEALHGMNAWSALYG
jgi:hypothetical protein